ncbi:hypothetical protein [Streptomyces coriariae]|uniref:hypothetical protein n=1 Tax=Streptomyces coriariae TaxID=2864460 RepID=UPI001E3243A1|nr:hypothetical protein [Streptomyces coriariae]
MQRAGAHLAQGPRTLGLTTIRLAQGRTAEIEPVMRAVYDSVGAPVGVALALVLARLGRLDEARAVSFPAEPVTDHLYAPAERTALAWGSPHLTGALAEPSRSCPRPAHGGGPSRRRSLPAVPRRPRSERTLIGIGDASGSADPAE